MALFLREQRKRAIHEDRKGGAERQDA